MSFKSPSTMYTCPVQQDDEDERDCEAWHATAWSQCLNLVEQNKAVGNKYASDYLSESIAPTPEQCVILLGTPAWAETRVPLQTTAN